jgi:hypothetical protein
MAVQTKVTRRSILGGLILAPVVGPKALEVVKTTSSSSWCVSSSPSVSVTASCSTSTPTCCSTPPEFVVKMARAIGRNTDQIIINAVKEKA